MHYVARTGDKIDECDLTPRRVPKFIKGIARLLLTGRTLLVVLAHEQVRYLLDVAHVADGVASIGVDWAKARNMSSTACHCSRMNLGPEGQVAQESNRRLAVLEVAAHCSTVSRIIPER